MDSDIESARPSPKAFISYSWDDEPHKQWVLALATRLHDDGVKVTFDQWDLQLGDQLPEFMERAIRDNDFALIVCTPNYAKRSNGRIGGAGYEGHIMTAEMFTTGNQRKFIPVLRSGDWKTAAPTWLTGKLAADLRGNPFADQEYTDLVNTLHGTRPKAPAVQPRRRSSSPSSVPPEELREDLPFEPVRILNIVLDEVTTPSNDGTRRSALYCIPFQLARRPPDDWGDVFIHKWRNPPAFDSMHRPRIAEVRGDRIFLNGTTMDEFEKHHHKTLMAVLKETNAWAAEGYGKKTEAKQRQRRTNEEHKARVQDGAKRIKFD